MFTPSAFMQPSEGGFHAIRDAGQADDVTYRQASRADKGRTDFPCIGGRLPSRTRPVRSGFVENLAKAACLAARLHRFRIRRDFAEPRVALFSLVAMTATVIGDEAAFEATSGGGRETHR